MEILFGSYFDYNNNNNNNQNNCYELNLKKSKII